MSLNEMLMTWPHERLVKELAQQAKDNAALRERAARLECELFWLKVPAAELAPSAATVLLRELTQCAGGMVNGNRLSRRAIEALSGETPP